MLGSLNLYFTSSLLTAGEGAAAAAAGAMLAVLPGLWTSRSPGGGRASRIYLATCGVASGIGLAVLPFLNVQGLETLPLLLLGLAAGGSWGLAVDLILPVYSCRRGLALLGLAGASFGLGGVVASLAAATAVNLLSLQSLLPFAAIVSVTLGWAGIRARNMWSGTPGTGVASTGLYPGAGPRRVLMVASVLLQASACGIAATSLLVYLSRVHGMSFSAGLAVLAVFWLAIAVGLSGAGQLPHIRETPAPLGVPAALVAAGGLLLFFAVGAPGALIGTVLLGSGTGALLLLTLRLAQGPPTLCASKAITRAVRASPVTALGIGWPVGILSAHWGTSILLLAVLACLAAALVALAVLTSDYRLSGDPAVI